MDEPDSPDPLPTQPWTGPADPTVRMPQDGTPAPTTPGARPGGWQAPEPEQLQASFPQYEIQSVLGRGGMGAVYKGWQKSLKRFVAIKILPPGLEDDGANFAERFQREAQAMARFSHPGIVAVYDAGETPDGLFYFVMEYIEGTDVQKMVRENGPLPPEHALAIAAHVCDALAYAHKRGVIHRDIKPANIMVDTEGQVKVADFGLAKVANDDGAALVTGSHVSMGTMDFMAPEALYGMGHVDHRADLYAVGVMLYQMLTGELPRGRFELPSIVKPELDPRFDAIIDRAMQKNPEKRYASATDIRSDLDQILTQPVPHRSAAQQQSLSTTPSPEAAAKPVAQKSLPPSEPAPARKRRFPGAGLGGRTRVWLSSAIMAAVCAIIGGAMWVTDHDSRSPNAQPLAESWPSPANALPATTSGAPEHATKDTPFVNSLGMKFVPVPGTGVLFCQHVTRVKDYAAFAQGNEKTNGQWKKVEFQGMKMGSQDEYPVVDVSWDDAQAFCSWLSEKEGRTYRLPTDREWSIAVGIGELEGRSPPQSPEALSGKLQNVFPWGTQWPPPVGAGNYADISLHDKVPTQATIFAYNDGYPVTSPVTRFRPNQFGLHDMGGNVWQWCADPADSAPTKRILRGGSWRDDLKGTLISSNRRINNRDHRISNYGFRVVLAGSAADKLAAPTSSPIIPAGQEAASDAAKSVMGSPLTATKDILFTNSLGMKFVPVPITGGPTNKQRVLFSVWETRVQDFEAFTKETKREWKKPDFEQGPTHPAVNVSRDDATDFCTWLTEKERRAGKLGANEAYRIPTDHEWSCAAGVGNLEDASEGFVPGGQQANSFRDKFYFWGTGPIPAGAGNFADDSLPDHLPWKDIERIPNYHDGQPFTSPVGSFPANASGLADLDGNAREMCTTLQPELLVIRGGSWKSEMRRLRVMWRDGGTGNGFGDHHGFRVVLAPASEVAR